MNDADIEFALLCRAFAERTATTQRDLAAVMGLSLGKTNQLVAQARERGLLDASSVLTEAGSSLLESCRVDNAIILAAGFGSRFVPLTYETPKGLLPVKGTPMLERQIQQLHGVGITEIVVVVGYLKEAFDYLVDEYGVTLVYNPEFATKNNYASLYHVRQYLKSSYILVADDWMEHNIFHTWEPQSWISAVYFDGPTDEWVVDTNARGRIRDIRIGGANDWGLIGPAFFTADFTARFVPLLEAAYVTPGTENWYWEHILKNNLRDLPMYLNRQSRDVVMEFENLGELRAYDPDYWQETHSPIMAEIATALQVPQEAIVHIEPLKDGLTNATFRFEVKGVVYVFHLPQAADVLVDWRHEQAVYAALEGREIADDMVWFNASNGHRITRFYDGVRTPDPADDTDLAWAMASLRQVHDMGAIVGHKLDLLAAIDIAEQRCRAIDAIQFSDYDQVRARLEGLMEWFGAQAVPAVLCHGDFLAGHVFKLTDGSTRIVDWERGGMGDPFIDIAMFGIDARFDQARLDMALDAYLARPATRQERTRLYVATALSGLYWTLFAEYRQAQGQAVGGYPLVTYRYAKNFQAKVVAESLLR